MAGSPIMEFKAAQGASGRSRRALEQVSRLSQTDVVVLEVGGEKVDLPGVLVAMLSQLASEVGQGHDVVMVRSDAELTPAQAAKLLGFSRQYLVRLLDDGVIPSRRLPGSSHRRIALDDVRTFQERRGQRRQGVNKVMDAVADAGLTY